MKVIGKGEKGDEYICIVSHTELEKLTENYYGKLIALKVGAEMNLGAGYDFRSAIQRACETMTDASKRFSEAQATMFKFAVMVKDLPIEAAAEVAP